MALNFHQVKFKICFNSQLFGFSVTFDFIQTSSFNICSLYFVQVNLIKTSSYIYILIYFLCNTCIYFYTLIKQFFISTCSVYEIIHNDQSSSLQISGKKDFPFVFNFNPVKFCTLYTPLWIPITSSEKKLKCRMKRKKKCCRRKFWGLT